MQVWLEPIEGWHNTGMSPVCAVLTRIGYALDKANCPSDQISQLGYLAARILPGNLMDSAGNLDIDAYASEVVRTERDRLDFPRHLRHELDQIKKRFNQQDIEWCFPILDPELNLPAVVQFVKGLRGQSWLTIYIVCDVDLSNFFLHERNVVHINETTFKAMNVTLGIPKAVIPLAPVLPPLPPLPPVQPFTPPAPMPSFFDDIDEEPKKEDNLPAKKGKPQYRSILDPLEPSW
jgi:hypothetical protein